MSQNYSKHSVEVRLERLENKVEKQKTVIQALTTMVVFKASSPFDSPLKQFFDDAAKFFDDVYEDAGACYNACFAQYQGDLKAAGDDENKIAEAQTKSTKCMSGCPPLVP